MVGEKLMNSAGQCLLGAFWDVLRMFPTPKDCFGLSIAGLQLGRRLWSTKRWRLPGEDEPLVVRTVRKKLAKSPGLRPRPSKTFLGCVHSDLLRHCETLLVMWLLSLSAKQDGSVLRVKQFASIFVCCFVQKDSQSLLDEARQERLVGGCFLMTPQRETIGIEDQDTSSIAIHSGFCCSTGLITLLHTLVLRNRQGSRDQYHFMYSINYFNILQHTSADVRIWKLLKPSFAVTTPHNSPRLGQVGLDLNLDLTDTYWHYILGDSVFAKKCKFPEKSYSCKLKGSKGNSSRAF